MKKAWWGLPCIGLASLGVLGCGGPDFDAICSESESCRGGNDKDIAACVAVFEGRAEAASDIGCGDEFDAYYECTLDQMSCRTVSTGQPCSSDADCADVGSSPTCSGGECMIKSYGNDPDTSTDDVCHAEERAWSHCN